MAIAAVSPASLAHGFGVLAALEELRQRPYALTLLDAKLPDLDGLELARRIRALNLTSPIILVSGYFYPEDAAIQEAHATGLIQGFVGKPFLHEQIVRAVRKAVFGRL